MQNVDLLLVFAMFGGPMPPEMLARAGIEHAILLACVGPNHHSMGKA
jgi:hypothetical protein